MSNGTFGWTFSCALAVRITFDWSKSIAVNTFGWFSRSAALQFRALGGALTFDLGAWPKSGGVLGTWLMQLPLLRWREPPRHVSMPAHLVFLEQKCWRVSSSGLWLLWQAAAHSACSCFLGLRWRGGLRIVAIWVRAWQGPAECTISSFLGQNSASDSPF